MDNQEDAQATTQDYIDAIKQAKASGKAVSINFGSLPQGVVAAAIQTELHNGLPDDYINAIGDAANRGKTISLDFGQIKQPQTGGELSPWQTLTTLAPSLLGNGGPLETPWGKFKDLFPKAGGAVAEGLGKAGVNPNVAAAVSLPIAMAPDIATTLPMAYPAASTAENAVSRASDIINSGKRIGAAEQAIGVITKAADKYPTAGNVGEVLNTLESQLQNGTLTNPQELQQAQDMVRYIWSNPKIVGKTPAITAQAARVSQAINQAFNAAVPGRAGAAADYATLMKFVGPVKAAGQYVADNYKPIAVGAGALAAIKHYLLNR